ncbi:MAG TPA: hypothetical protein VF635_15805 [Propionibacteriaceae bacterium]
MNSPHEKDLTASGQFAVDMASAPTHVVMSDDVLRRTEWLLAVAGTLLIAMRVTLPQLLTVGAVVSFATVPLWYPLTRHYVGARSLLFVGVAAVPCGIVLTWLAAADHDVQLGSLFSAIMVLLGTLASFGFLLWARVRLGDRLLAVTYGLGLLATISTSTPLYATNPWKFGFAVPVTVLLLALVSGASKFTQLAAAAVLLTIATLNDARSSFGIITLTAALLVWQMRPGQSTRRRSGVTALFGFGVLAAVIYNVGQALIIGGYFGAQTRARSLRQLDTAGSLILGGRPEIAGTLALMRDRVWGLGAGTMANHHDITVAKTGMAAISYDPNNGYVDNYMFGNGFSLHSITGDLWADFGIVGLLLSLLIFALVLRSVGQAVANRVASGLLLYTSFLTLWNIVFSPWWSAIPILMLTLALTVVARELPEASPPTGATPLEPRRARRAADSRGTP